MSEADLGWLAFGGCTETMIEGLSNVGSDDAGINTAVLNFGSFFMNNLIPVSLGNIVGGVLVGLMMYYCHATRQGK